MNERIAFLEAEVSRLEIDLALKSREVEVERALEKIRVKALDMHNSAELSETSILLFQQLKELKIEPIRSGVGIFDDAYNAIELWVTAVAEDGSLYFVLDFINIHVHPIFENIIESWRAGKLFSVTSLEGKKLVDYYMTMSTYTGIPDRKGLLDREFFYSFFFSLGAINLVSSKELTQEETGIMLRLANVFGLIYTRFLDLKKTEDQAELILQEKTNLESTLDHLKATQSQLIHSEKMASLGELTAGIAHEIQNPLNFVNNFSEINKELLAEMREALSRNDLSEAVKIADNVIENEEKINIHGKRADAIVKGMLQHSRSSVGVQESTDINKLADEYVKLAYHGFRAKDNSFNARIKTDFDDSIEKINIIPQDLGRVLLNLYNNAFYAISEKKKQIGEG